MISMAREMSLGRGGGSASGRGRGATRGRREERPTSYDVVKTRPEGMASKKGSTGRPIDLMTNYLGFKMRPDYCVFKYRVDFSHQEELETDTRKKKILFRQHEKTLPAYLFDGTMCYTVERLFPVSQKDRTLTSSWEDREAGKNVIVIITLRLTGQVYATDNDYIHFFNMIKQQAIEQLGLKQMKRDYFDPKAATRVDQWQLEVWPGYITTIRQHEHELLLCVEVSAKILRTDSAFNTIEVCKQKYRGPEVIKAIQKALIGAVVVTPYNNKTYRVDDVDFTQTPTSTFERKDGSKISYAQYFKDRHNFVVRNMQQPMLISMPKDKDRRRGDDKPVVLIPEFTNMTGLTDEQRNNFKLTQAISDWTRMRPPKRVDTIEKFSSRMTGTPAVKEVFQKWGMEIDPQMKRFKGRVLPPEKIFLRNEVTYNESNADWDQSLKNGMFENKIINKVYIVVPRAHREATEYFWKLMRDVSPGLNVQMGTPRWEELPDSRVTTYTGSIADRVFAQKPEMVVVVIPRQDQELYSALKKLMCIQCPMLSQVITCGKVINKGNKSVATKIVVQMAVKMGAKPWKVKVPLKGFMVAGFDTYHLKEGDTRATSYGAFTASLDPDLCRYFSRSLGHQAGEEISQNLPVMFTQALKHYRHINGAFPKKVFFYRDGVGEGQLKEVIQGEINSIKQVLKDTGEDIKLTFIVVSKRINTRFFASFPGKECGNPPSGTVADDVATLPERYDFFLISQSVRQGTVNPTSYNVIEDGSGLGPDKVQQMTYKLTHLYYNWPGTVRVPAPCMYAHKLAKLMGESLKNDVNPALTQQNVLYYL